MSNAFELEICQGKYRYRYEAGKQEVWRNGEPWEVMNGKLIGDKFVFSLAVELDEALKERDALRTAVRHESDCVEAAKTKLKALHAKPAPRVPNGWKEAAIAWEVCASIHREYGKGKDPFFNTRQGDFVKHANDARAMLATRKEK